MNGNDREIVRLFANRVREHFPEARVIFFGSRARGDCSPEADFDVCVLAATIDRNARDIIGHIAWEVGFENAVLIVPVVYAEDDFASGPRSVSPLTRSILKEGIPA